MAFLSGETLEKFLPGLIDPFDANLIDCAAYTLRMGREVYVSPSASEQDAEQISIRQLEENEAFAIPAGQFAFLLTEEKIKVPPGKLALISMKSGMKLRGLVNVSGFHVDPGYHGNLVFAVFNAGPRPIHLKRGEHCFLIWYANLDDEQSKKARDPKNSYSSITTDLVTRISGEVMSFEGLNAKIKELEKSSNDRIHKVERDHQVIFTFGKIVLGLIVAIVITPYAKHAWDWWTNTAPIQTQQQLAPPNSQTPAATPKN